MLRLACFISYFMAVAISVAGAPLRSGPAAAGLRPSSAHHSGLREGGSTSDWPAYRHDNRRSGMTEETLSLPLSPAWRYVCPQPPAPAWPLSLRKAHLMDFDYAAAPVVAGGLLVFGSSADDTVRALDARTGAERWHFISDGPVRFAPQLASNRVYFGSDDGCVYCLEAATGKPVWIFNTAPADEALIGNGRMISRWPIRTGVLVHDNLVFAVAGMWPAEGIYVYALDAASGKIVWCNDTSGLAARGIGQPWDAGDPHRGEFSFLGPTPQGALLASRDFLIAPLGLNAPAYYNLKTGALKEFGYRGGRGVWHTIDGWYKNPTKGTMQYSFMSTDRSGNNMMLWGSAVPDQGLPASGVAQFRDVPNVPSSRGKVSAVVRDGQPYVRAAYCLIMAGDTLFAGENNAVVAFDAATSNELWRAPVAGEARELAVADGRLFVSTHTGEITCFAPAFAKATAGKPGDKPAGLPAVGAPQTNGRESSPLRSFPPRVKARDKLQRESSMNLIHSDPGFPIRSGMTNNAQSRDTGGRSEDSSQHSEIGNRKSNIYPAPGGINDPIIKQLRSVGMDHGFALVVGDSDGKISLAVATGTALHVVNALTDLTQVQRLREQLLVTTDLYGSRVHVLGVSRLDRLPFAQYFANAVIVAGQVAGISGAELYRVLRPCGGILLLTGLNTLEAQKLMHEVKNAENHELSQLKENGRVLSPRAPVPLSGGQLGELSLPLNNPVPCFVRGPLPGARDWNANVKGDRRVRWPLRPIWFGGPDSALVITASGFGGHSPVAANGYYFVTGEDSLSAVDAYNGATLWTRPIPAATPGVRQFGGISYGISNGIGSDAADTLKRWLTADGQYVYLRLGKQYFRGTNEALIQLDARTGEQLKFYGPHTAPPRVSLDTPQTWSLELDATRGGAVTAQKTQEGLCWTLVTRDPSAAATNAWDLHFDFRPEHQRYGLYDAGAFMVTVRPAGSERAQPELTYGTGTLHPRFTVTGRPTTNGAETIVLLPWPEIQKITGSAAPPANFGFAATLNAWIGQVRQPVAQGYLFGDAVARGLNNGWATLVLQGGGATMPGPRPAIVGGTFADAPKNWPKAELWNVDPAYLGDPGTVDETVRAAPRRHPLTGQLGPRIYRAGSGECGNPVYAARIVVGRTTKQALGFYDFVEDSGLHFFPGIAANCGVNMGKANNMAAALGLLIFSESRGHCECVVPMRTSLAFAPAERRLAEDWAMFSDRNANAPIRSLALNLGAFGDRRAEDGTLWLSYPREPGGKAYPLAPGSHRRYLIDAPPISGTLQLPVQVAVAHERFRWSWPYRLNADRAVIAGTLIPWLYASGGQGLTSVVVRLLDPAWIVASSSAAPPAIDGRLEDQAWAGATQAVLPFAQTAIRLRHDQANLYVAAQRPPVIDRRSGQIQPWKKETAGEDAPVWSDDAFEVFFSDARGQRVVHLGVAASGARYDALSVATNREDRRWNGSWRSAVAAQTNGFSVELAIPWKTLAQAGLAARALSFNAQMCQQSVANEWLTWGAPGKFLPRERTAIPEPLLSLGDLGRERCEHFTSVGLDAPPLLTPRSFTVRLHFAEPNEAHAVGARVFDVKLQGQTVLKNFDIVKEAGAPRRALVKEFKQVKAGPELNLEFVPSGKELTAATAPVLSGLELYDEEFRRE